MHGPKIVQVSAGYKKLNVTRKQWALKRDAGRQLWTLFVDDEQDGVSTFFFFFCHVWRIVWGTTRIEHVRGSHPVSAGGNKEKRKA